ncbi:YtcA family lipoprotein [Burkholderia contaminans]|uniref:YtcA family lipoprotein n=1 Tax=Burkholderia contaminans TaxID=488447 RepID=UPI001FC7CCAB|nr:YtcA family lipoprotein [Burkholderia contaminans]
MFRIAVKSIDNGSKFSGAWKLMTHSNQTRNARARRQLARVPARAVMLVGLLLAGCSRAPSIVLFGAAFPDWLFCIAGGVFATVLVHLILGATRWVVLLQPLPLSYPGLTAIFAASIWMLVFYH